MCAVVCRTHVRECGGVQTNNIRKSVHVCSGVQPDDARLSVGAVVYIITTYELVCKCVCNGVLSDNVRT